jgi:hypothetical protein
MNEDEMMLLDDEDLAEGTPATTNEPEPKAEEVKTEVDQPKAETPQPEDEDKKMLDYLNSKGLIKFNGEAVQVKDLNDLVTNYQKGLNYDRLTQKENTVMDYIKEKASSLNISPEEYIGRVKSYEEQKKKEAQEEDIQRYVNSGLSEEIAREIVQTKLARQELEKEKAEYQKRIAEEEKKSKEDAEYVEFIKAHPEIKVDEIPQEVFDMSREIGITAAYNQYENKLLKEKIKQFEQSIKNASSSPVSLTSDGSTTEQNSKDAFFEGFDSE